MGPIVITGGGTGGHVFPMQAIAERLQAKGVPKSELRYVGSERGQESVLLAGDGVTLTLLPGRGIRRSLSFDATLENLGAVWGLARAVAIAVVKVRRWRPAAVVSVGGYASFAVAGVDRALQARDEARRSFEPVVDEGRSVVVVMTGSLGSARVNRAVLQLAQLWAKRTDVSLWHVAGRRDFESVLGARPVTNGLDYRVVEFADMARLWAIADVAVCRAGAVTLAELTLLAIPSVLVPLPNAPGDHQTKNAERVVDAGGARMIDDASCTGDVLAQQLDAIMQPGVREAMSRAAASIARPDAAGAIADVVIGARRR